MRKRFKALRREVGLTQEKLAEYLGVDQSLVSRFESGERDLTMFQVESCCALFGVNSLRKQEKSMFSINYKKIPQEQLKAIAEVNRIALNIIEMEGLDV